MTIEKTIKNAFKLTGIGIHSGQKVSIECLPQKAQKGIQFIRNHISIPVTAKNIMNGQRATHLHYQDTQVHTPEHLLAALAGLGITALTIKLSANEVPIFDGSAEPFVNAIKTAGIQALDQEINAISIKNQLRVEDNDAHIIAIPATQMSFSFCLAYPNTFIGSQMVHFNPQEDAFETEIAPARTYGFLNEYEALLKQGLAKGANSENAIIIGDTDYQSKLRFNDELARHKLLDLMGDLWILGRPINAHIIGFKSGHALTHKLIQKIAEQ